MQDDRTTGWKAGDHLDKGTVHAWLDGELPASVSAEIVQHVDECGECAALVAEARGLMAASSRILSALDDERSNVTRDADRSVAAAFADVLERHRRESGDWEGDASGEPGVASSRHEPVSSGDAAVGSGLGRGDEPATGRKAAAASDGVVPMSSRRRRSVLHDPRWRVAAAVLVLAGASALILSEGDVTSVMDAPTTFEAATSDASAGDTMGMAGQARGVGSSRLRPESVATDIGGSEPEREVALPPEAPAEPRNEQSARALATTGARSVEPSPAAEAPGTEAPPPPSPAPAPPAAGAQAARSAAPRRGDTMTAQAYQPEIAALQGKVAGAVMETRVLRGRVRSTEPEQPVSGATVHVPGAAAAVVTDAEGRFAIPVTADDSVLVVRGIGYRAASVDVTGVGRGDSVTVILEQDVVSRNEVVVAGVTEDSGVLNALLEAWLAEGAAPNDPRVVGAAGCWALVGGRVPGATEGVVLRLHGATNDAARTWVPMGADSLLVRLAGSSELRLERSGDRLSGQTRRSRVVGTAGVAIEFARVACPEDG